MLELDLGTLKELLSVKGCVYIIQISEDIKRHTMQSPPFPVHQITSISSLQTVSICTCWCILVEIFHAYVQLHTNMYAPSPLLKTKHATHIFLHLPFSLNSTCWRSFHLCSYGASSFCFTAANSPLHTCVITYLTSSVLNLLLKMKKTCSLL